jgi:hypothetical protein
MTKARTLADNFAADINGITAGTGITGGGTSGTVTVTNEMATVIDAKGDLVGGTGADAFARLAVGANGTVLTADSVETTGLKWVTPASPSYTWTSFTPTVTSQGGTPTTVTATSKYAQIGKVVIYQILIEIVAIGTASGHINIDLPVAHESGTTSNGYAVEYQNTGESGNVIQLSSVPYIRNYNFSTWWANGNKVMATLIYKAA